MTHPSCSNSKLGLASRKCPGKRARVPRHKLRTQPWKAAADCWLEQPPTSEGRHRNKVLFAQLREQAVEQAATLVCAHSRGLIVAEAQLIGKAGMPVRRFEESDHPHADDNLARAYLAGSAASCIANRKTAHLTADKSWSEVLALIGDDIHYFAQLWAENVVYLTGPLAWSTVVLVAEKLLSVPHLSGEAFAEAVHDARARYHFWKSHEKYQFAQRMQSIRKRMPGKDAFQFEIALGWLTVVSAGTLHNGQSQPSAKSTPRSFLGKPRGLSTAS